MSLYDDYHLFIKTHPIKKIGTLSYRYQGQGDETILLLLGGSMFPSEAYFRLILDLEKETKVLTIIYPKDTLTIKEMVESINKLISSLDLKEIFLMGASHGGGIAQVFSKTYPSSVKGLILYNTLTKTTNMSEHAASLIKDVLHAIDELKALRDIMPLHVIKDALLGQIEMMIDDPIDLELFELLISRYDEHDEKTQMAFIQDLLVNHTLSPDDFNPLDHKTLLFYAHDDDPFGGTDLIETLAELMPHPSLEFIDSDRFKLVIYPSPMTKSILSFIKQKSAH